METIATILETVLSKIGLSDTDEFPAETAAFECSDGFVEFNGYLFPAESPRQLKERLIASGVPMCYLERSPAEYRVDDNNREAMEHAKTFVEDPKSAKGLYICGPYGTGKTWLAVLICRKLAQKGKYVIFASFAEIMDKLQQSIGYKNGEYLQLWEKYTQEAEILFIDDIGREKPTEWKLQKLFELIDARGKNNLPTVFTSNYSKTDLLGRISADDKNNASAGAVCSRLKPFETLVLLGEDRRR